MEAVRFTRSRLFGMRSRHGTKPPVNLAGLSQAEQEEVGLCVPPR